LLNFYVLPAFVFPTFSDFKVVYHEHPFAFPLSAVSVMPLSRLRGPRPGQLTDIQMCPRKFPLSQHQPSVITAPRFKVPAHSDPVKRWNFRKTDWKRFCLLTGESIG